jgi:hypothetical protein
VQIDLAELRAVSVCFEEGRRRRNGAATLSRPAAPVAARLLGKEREAAGCSRAGHAAHSIALNRGLGRRALACTPRMAGGGRPGRAQGGLQRRARMGFHGLEAGPEWVSGLGQDGLRPARIRKARTGRDAGRGETRASKGVRGAETDF